MPDRLSTFLIELRADTPQGVQEKGTTFYEVSKNIFAACNTPEVALGAAARTSNVPQSKNRLYSKAMKGYWWGSHGTIIDFPHSKSRHGQKICDENPNIKRYMDIHLKCMQNKAQRYTERKKCYCCWSIGHEYAFC